METKNVFTWNRSGALGDVISTLNLLPSFRTKHPDAKVFYLCHKEIGGIAQDLILAAGFDGVLMDNKFAGKEIRLVGYPVPENKVNPGRHPYQPMEKHLIEYFADELEVVPDFESFILNRPNLPISEKYITIQVKAGWSMYKNWDYENWNKLCFKLQNDKIPIYQIGGPSDPKIPYATGRIFGPDPRQQFNTCIAALSGAVLHAGVDSWANHATNIQWRGPEGEARRTLGVILWGSSQISATGYVTNRNITASLSCSPCFKEDPKISRTPLKQCHNPAWQTYENPKHKCMADITVDEVYKNIIEVWEARSGSQA